MTGKKLIVEYNLKPIIAKEKMRVSKDFFITLENKMKAQITEAIKKALANQRTTVMGRDL